MELKVTRRRPPQMGVHSPKALSISGNNSNTNSANCARNFSPVPGGGIHPSATNNSSSIAANSGGRGAAKSRPLPVSRSDSLLKPTAARGTLAMASGTRIRRRPPSAQGRVASPLLTRPGVASLKKEIIEHRTDPSPAPSRPPRAVKRYSLAVSPPILTLNPAPPPRGVPEAPRMTSAFHSGGDRGGGRRTSTLRRPPQDTKKNSITGDSNSAAAPSSPSAATLGIGRRNIVLDAKQSLCPRSGGTKQTLEALSPTVKSTRLEAVRCYRKLCHEIGQAPEEAWIEAVLGDCGKAAPMNPTAMNSTLPPGEKKLLAAESAAVTSPTSSGGGVGAAHPIGEQGGKRGIGSSRRSSLRTRSVGEAKRSGSAQKRVGGVGAQPAVLSSIGGMVRERSPSDTYLEHMVLYCQHLQPYRQKMEALKKRREEVQNALERFLGLCRNNQQQGNYGGSKLFAMTALESQAKSLTDGLRDLQRCNVALLLRLAEYSREVRRPLGSASYVAETGSNELRQQVPQPASVSLQASTTSPIARPQSAPLGQRPLTPLGQLNGNTTAASLFVVPSSTEPPIGYANFLRAEEHRIVQQLTEVCQLVRDALLKGVTVAIADDSMLSTPLFLPSGAFNHFAGAEGDRPKQQQSAGDSGQRFDRSSAAGSAASSSAFSPFESTGNLRTYTTRSTGSPVSSDHRAGKGVRSGAVADDHNSAPSTDHFNRDEIDDHSPFVGVALMGWTTTTTDDNNNNSNAFLRHNTGTPQLVLGGGRRCFSLYPAAPKPASGSGQFARSKSAGSSTIHKKKTTAKIATATSSSATTPVNATANATRRQKSKASSKVSGASGVTDVIAAAQIREAEGAWETIKGLMAPLSERQSVQAETDDSSCSRADSQKLVSTQNERPTTATPQRQSPTGNTPGKDLESPIPCSNVPIAWAEGGQKQQEQKYAGTPTAPRSASSALALYRESVQRKQAAAVIVRFLRHCLWRKSRLAREAKRGLQEQQQQQQGPQEKQQGTAITTTTATTKSEVMRSPSRGALKLLEVSKTHEAMAVRIARCWRRYAARQKLRHLRREVEEERRQRQVWHYENLMAHRLQRLFAKATARRRRCEALQRKCASKPELNGSVSTFTDSSINTENKERPLTTRERYERAKGKRRELLRVHLDGYDSVSEDTKDTTCNQAVTATTKSDKPLQQKQEQVCEASAKVPPLDLKNNRLSTFFIENYRPATENFGVGVLHRLLHAPKALLYAVRVMCDVYPPRPDSALEALATAERGSSKLRSVSAEKHQLLPLQQQEDDDVGGGGGGAAEEGPSQDCTSSSSSTDGRDTMQQELMHCKIVPYRTLRRCLLSRRIAIKKRSVSMPLTCPLSVRVESYVVANEVCRAEPLQKSFQRPFERWGTAHAFQRRAFSAAAVYAWKLIFSHTPHDDYKQRMLKTREEREARLERVEQRNRMILACYCVHSEREWLKEASKDLTFVAHIWNPKNSLDPNDPDFERHCRETYEFVEDFLYQCFPTLTSLDDVPAFLMGAGIFFVLKSVLENLDVDETASDGSSEWQPPTCPTAPPLATRQRHAVYTYELLDLVDSLTFWRHCTRVEKDTETGQADISTTRSVKSKEKDNNDGGEDCSDPLERTTRSLMAIGQLATGSSVSLTSLMNDAPVDVTDVGRPHLRLVVGPSLSTSAATSPTAKASPTAKRHGNTGGELKGCAPMRLLCPKGYLVGLSERLARSLLGLTLDLEVCEDLDAVA